MKKFTALIIALALLGVFAGCTLQDAQDESATPPASGSPTDSTASEEPSPSESVSPSSDSASPPASQTMANDDNAGNETYTEIIQLEGMDETVTYRLVTGSYGYTIPMDVDRFEFSSGDGADYLTATANDKVYIDISYLADTTTADAAQSLQAADGVVRSEENPIMVGDYDATNVHVVYGDAPDSKVVNHYLIAHKTGVFVVSAVYFVEAAEGFGARMHYMVQGFKIQ